MAARAIITAVAICTLAAPTAFAQTDRERFERQLEQIQRDTRARVDGNVPADQRALIDFGAYTSISFFAIDDQDQNTQILRQYDLVGFTRINIDSVHEFFVRSRTSYRDFNSGDAFDDHGDDWIEPTLDRGYYRFNLQRYLAAYEDQTTPWNVVVQGGRQLVDWANGLTLSEVIDGGLITISYDPVTLDLIGGVTRDSITDLDSSRPGFDNNTKRGFYGAMLTVQAGPNHRPFIYGLVQEDDNNDETLVIGAVPTSFGYDSHYIGVGSQGSINDNLIYGIEAVYQGGTTLSNSFDPATGLPITQSRDHIEAFAADIEVTYLFGDANRSRVGAELLIASGDDDRLFHTTNTFGGNAPGTKDKSFNAFGLVNTGLAFATSTSNLIMLRGGGSTFPLPNSETFKHLQVGGDIFIFNKFDDEAPIDETTTDQTYLGTEADIFAVWQMTSDLTFTLRYGVFFPGQAIATDHDTRHFLFTGVTVAY